MTVPTQPYPALRIGMCCALAHVPYCSHLHQLVYFRDGSHVAATQIFIIGEAHS